MAFLKSKKFLYFPGCVVTSVLPEISENYELIFNKLNLDIYRISQNICCGSIAHSNGYTKDFENLKERATEIFLNSPIKNIVTNSSNCLWTLATKYGFKVQHVTQLLAKFKDKLPVMYDEEVSYYDAPDLKIHDAPREVLQAIGFDIIELEKNIICGAEGGMIQNVPQLSIKLAKEVFNMCNTKKLIVADPLAYYHLKKNSPKNIQVLELSEVFNR
ncbi:MAG: (Fe-S)-binding protein [Candidatus Woesearchaeota archaeon]